MAGIYIPEEKMEYMKRGIASMAETSVNRDERLKHEAQLEVLEVLEKYFRPKEAKLTVIHGGKK